MNLKSSVYIATSLDGFIARSDGELDWLDAANKTVPAEVDCGYNSFMESIDVLIIGRNTYEQILTFDNWPYGNKTVIVLSSNKITIPKKIAQSVSYSSESPRNLCERLNKEGIKNLYIDGGITIQRFLSEGLIDNITITIIPIILGSGKPLFSNLKKDILLKLLDTKHYDFGFVQITYEVIKNV